MFITFYDFRGKINSPTVMCLNTTLTLLLNRHVFRPVSLGIFLGYTEFSLHAFIFANLFLFLKYNVAIKNVHHGITRVMRYQKGTGRNNHNLQGEKNKSGMKCFCFSNFFPLASSHATCTLTCIVPLSKCMFYLHMNIVL